MLTFRILHPAMTSAQLGIIPMFCHDADPRPAREQIDENYQHGGGWSPIPNFTANVQLTPDILKGSPYVNAKQLTLHYPNDPPLQPLAVAQFRDETLIFYPFAMLAIFQTDYSFEVGRLD